MAVVEGWLLREIPLWYAHVFPCSMAYMYYSIGMLVKAVKGLSLCLRKLDEYWCLLVHFPQGLPQMTHLNSPTGNISCLLCIGQGLFQID